jgi:ribonuclease Y
MALRMAVVSLLAALAVGTETEMWGPADGVKAFAVLETALNKITSIHMSDEESKHAEKVAADVRAAIKVVESNNTNLTKAQRNEKIGQAVQELMELQAEFKPRKQLSQEEAKKRMAELEQQLKAKKELLAKEESMIKLYTLQKELAEKKLQLQKLIEKKEQSEAAKKSGAAEAADEAKFASKIMNLSSDLAKTDKKAELSAPVKAALAEVQARAKKESTDLAKMEEVNKKTMAELDSEAKKMQIKGGDKMLHKLKRQEQRQFKKMRAQKQVQLNELKTLEQSIEQHDATKFTATLQKMEHDAKALTEKSGDFLH